MKKAEILLNLVEMMGHIDYPEEVIIDFRLGNDNETSNVWFEMMKNDLLFKHILIPELKVPALRKPILAFVMHKEIRSCVNSLAYSYLEYLSNYKEFAKIPRLHKFFTLEKEAYLSNNPCETPQQEEVYQAVIEWVESCLYNPSTLIEESLKKPVRIFFEVILLSRSNILNYPDFQEIITKNNTELSAIFF